jgi:hypothetical protein
MTRRLLVVTTAPDPSDELLEWLSHEAGEDIEVAVVAPVSDVSPLEWFSDDNDKALEEARRRAAEAAALEPGIAKVVDAHVGDADPVTAVQGALRKFRADELVVITRPRDIATWLEKRAITELERFGLPVTHLVGDDVVAPERVEHEGVFARAGDEFVAWVARNLLLTLALVAGALTAIVITLYSSFH